MEERTREWIHKPMINGVPVSWAEQYLQNLLKKYREEHPQFDEFLMGIDELLKNDDDPDLCNIKR